MAGRGRHAAAARIAADDHRLPRNSGRSRCSTAAKNASRST
jgi:hypothetical protein